MLEGNLQEGLSGLRQLAGFEREWDCVRAACCSWKGLTHQAWSVPGSPSRLPGRPEAPGRLVPGVHVRERHPGLGARPPNGCRGQRPCVVRLAVGTGRKPFWPGSRRTPSDRAPGDARSRRPPTTGSLGVCTPGTAISEGSGADPTPQCPSGGRHQPGCWDGGSGHHQQRDWRQGRRSLGLATRPRADPCISHADTHPGADNGRPDPACDRAANDCP